MMLKTTKITMAAVTVPTRCGVPNQLASTLKPVGQNIVRMNADSNDQTHNRMDVVVVGGREKVPAHFVTLSSLGHSLPETSGQTHCFSSSDGSRTMQSCSHPHPSGMAGMMSSEPGPAF